MKKPVGLAIVLLLAACGATQTDIPELGVTVDLPSGWSSAVDDYGNGPVAELSTDNLRGVNISAETTVVESLDILVAAMKDHTVVNKEELPTGFGGTFEKDGKKTFLYVVKKGDKSFRCEPGAYYKEEHLEDAVKICKSIR